MSRDHPWAELSEELGGVGHRGWIGNVPMVQTWVADTLVTVDLSPGDFGPLTRVQAYFPSDGTFRFGVRSSRVTTELSKLFFGTQDIIVGDKSFDRRFVVRGSDEARVQALFGRPTVLEALKGYWNLTLTAGPLGRWHLPQGVDGLGHLLFKSPGTLSVKRVRTILGLFREILAELGVADPIEDDDVTALLCRLRAPGGKLGLGFVPLWDGDAPRRQAAERLGKLQAPEAVEALIEVITDPDDGLRLAAMQALESIGDPAAVPALAGLLGDHDVVGSTVLWEGAAEALETLGAGDLVHGFQEALQGRAAALRDCVYRYRAAKPVARALVSVMKGSDLSAVEAAGGVLGWLGTAEVIPDLREIQRMTGWDRSRNACRKAIAAIETMPSLPRPAERPDEGGREGLPRAAGSPGPDRAALPRVVKQNGATRQDGEEP